MATCITRKINKTVHFSNGIEWNFLSQISHAHISIYSLTRRKHSEYDDSMTCAQPARHHSQRPKRIEEEKNVILIYIYIYIRMYLFKEFFSFVRSSFLSFNPNPSMRTGLIRIFSTNETHDYGIINFYAEWEVRTTYQTNSVYPSIRWCEERLREWTRMYSVVSMCAPAPFYMTKSKRNYFYFENGKKNIKFNYEL